MQYVSCAGRSRFRNTGRKHHSRVILIVDAEVFRCAEGENRRDIIIDRVAGLAAGHREDVEVVSGEDVLGLQLIGHLIHVDSDVVLIINLPDLINGIETTVPAAQNQVVYLALRGGRRIDVKYGVIGF